MGPVLLLRSVFPLVLGLEVGPGCVAEVARLVELSLGPIALIWLGFLSIILLIRRLQISVIGLGEDSALVLSLAQEGRHASFLRQVVVHVGRLGVELGLGPLPALGAVDYGRLGFLWLVVVLVAGLVWFIEVVEQLMSLFRIESSLVNKEGEGYAFYFFTWWRGKSDW